MGVCSSSTKNWGWAVTRRRSLNGSTKYPRTSAHPGSEITARVYRIDLHCRFACALSRPARRWRKLYRARKLIYCSLVANLPKHLSFVICKFRTARRRMLRTRLWMGMCETLMPDVMVPEAHQNDRSYMYVCELSGLTFNSLCKNLPW